MATSKIGLITRGMCTVLVVSAFSLFHIEEKRTFQPFDVGVTYALFVAVFGLDMATLLIWVYSDWAIAFLTNFDKESRRFKIIEMLLFPRKELREQPRSKDSLLFKFINKLLLFILFVLLLIIYFITYFIIYVITYFITYFIFIFRGSFGIL